MSRPKSVLDIEWGTDAKNVISQLGLTGGHWYKWIGGQEFEIYSGSVTCINFLGYKCVVNLIRQENSFDGIHFVFEDGSIDWQQLKNKVCQAFGLEQTDLEIYQIWNTGEIVRLTQDENKYVLTVAGPRFGKAYQTYMLSHAMSGFFNSLKPQ